MSNRKKQHALVLGGSIAGLLTACVLSNHFERVTIIEKDPLNTKNAPRKGVPQGHQLHIVLARGLHILERYLPGLTAELAAGGAIVSDDLALDFRWFSDGGYRPQVPTGLKSVMVSRPFLEETIRRRVADLPNVQINAGTKVAGLDSTPDGTRITGVKFAGGSEQKQKVDLVIDATGRGSKSSAWLAELGYTAPEVETVGVKIRYASRLFRRPKSFRTLIVTSGQPPHQARQGAVQPLEDDRLVVTLHGRGDDVPPADEAGFNAHARALLTQDIAETMAGLEPLSNITVYNLPKTRWHHYEKLSRFPAGYLVLGDAICALNPVYGQGMTSAAMQAEALDKLLSKRSLSNNFWKPYFKQMAKVVSTPWQMTVSEDFLFPQTEGTPPKIPGFIANYMGKLAQTINRDPVVFTAFFNVMHLMKPPITLFHPRIVWRVLFLKGKPSAQMSGYEANQQPAKAIQN
ncbi:MAG: FAD-dependent monooxygenase [Anaerolineae bacterium]|nr:FAD-dependent monooxygenase [Anaerolineae bacterium]